MNNKKNTMGKSIYILIIIGLVLAFIVLILEKQQIINLYTKPLTGGDALTPNSNDILESQPTAEEEIINNNVQSDQKSKFINSTDIDGNPIQPQTVSAASLDITISQENDNVIIKTKILNISDGVCELKITNKNIAITKMANVIYLPDSSTCAGFSVPKNELGVGTWQIALEVKPVNGDTISKDTSHEVI